MAVTPITQIDALATRLAKARALADQVSPAGPNGYEVSSSAGTHHVVDGHCDCPDSRFRRELHKGYCKHMLAVFLYEESASKPPEST